MSNIGLTKYTSQNIDNMSFDDTLKVSMVEIIGSDGTTQGERTTIIRTVGNYTYIGKAPIGSATASAVWQVKRLDTTNGLDKMWADSNSTYDNIWDNYLTLTYGY